MTWDVALARARENGKRARVPELPDITVYVEALEARVVGQVLERVRLLDIFVLRTAVPPIDALVGRRVTRLRRLGKRIAFGFDDGKWLVLHLMIAGRLHWTEGALAGPAQVKVNPLTSSGRAPSTGSGRSGGKAAIRNALAHLVFANGVLTLTEAGTKHRASLHVVADEAGLAAHLRGGLDVFAATTVEFGARLQSENHTLKRALTDPRLFDGIGNAYSDEILHAARMSPVRLTSKLKEEEIARLHEAARRTLREWTERLRAEAAGKFPANVTAFRPEMAVHGKFGEPCPVCSTAVQRIRYAENEVNYCPRCQTGGKLLADRSLSRLLNSDWPKTIEEWEERQAGR